MSVRTDRKNGGDSGLVKIAVILPCHNEEAAIAETVAGFRSVLPGAEVWVCDNASTDATASIAQAAGARVVREPRLGKGEAIRRLFADVEADVYVMADGDLTYDPAAAPEMVRKLVDEGLDMIVGNRLSSSGEEVYRPGHLLGNRMFTAVLRWFFGSTFSDVLSGYRVMSRRFVKSFPATSRGFEIESELTVLALEQRCPVAEVDTRYRPRPPGSESKLSTVRDGGRILTTLALLYRDVRPLPFFGGLASGLLLIGLLLFFPILETYLATGSVPRFPTLIVITGMFILAVIFITCGIILDRVAAARRSQQRIAYLRHPSPAWAGIEGDMGSRPRVSHEPAGP